MDRFYRILFVVVVVFAIVIIGYTFNKTVIKSDFVMIEEETEDEVASDPKNQTEDAINAQYLEDANI